MLSLSGNTAPFMLYAYARIRSICRKVAEDGQTWEPGEWPDVAGGEVLLEQKEEKELARGLVKFADTLIEVERALFLNKLADYLFDTSQRFNKFYENCPVNNAESEELKRSRLVLCVVTAQVLEKGLGLLGIDVLDKM